MKYKIGTTAKFKKQYKLAKKRGHDMEKLEALVNILASGEAIPQKYKDHALIGNWVGHRECHIEPNWLLIYYINNDVLVLTLTATGSHADLF